MGILIIYWHVQVPEPSHKMEEAGVHILLSEEIGRMMGTWSGDGETEARPPSWTSASPLPPSPRSQLPPSSSALYTPQCPHTLAQPSLPLRDNQAPKMLFAWNKLQYKTWIAQTVMESRKWKDQFISTLGWKSHYWARSCFFERDCSNAILQSLSSITNLNK